VPFLNPYTTYIKELADLYERSKLIEPQSHLSKTPDFNGTESAPTVLLFAPHPDDECILGACALRLMYESNTRVVVIPVSLGSAITRQIERREELNRSCSVLGFSIDHSLLLIRSAHASAQPSVHLLDTAMQDGTLNCLRRYKADYVIFPHANDYNSTHIQTSSWVSHALERYCSTPGARPVISIEGEYWHPNSSANLLVEVSQEQLAQLILALAQHTGEIRRNPYHISLPMWMMENVRRGSEIVLGKGATAVSFRFGVNYFVTRHFPGFYNHSRLVSAIANQLQDLGDALKGNSYEQK
jgi:N-acetylglucosamine malate deacetylase 1